MKNKTQTIVFPEHSPAIIAELLKKYNLRESPQEVFEKIHKKQPTTGRTLVNIVKERAQEKISQKELPAVLGKKLKISQKKSKEIAKDLEEQLLSLVERATEKPIETPAISPKLTAEKAEPLPKTKPTGPDVYREPVEQ